MTTLKTLGVAALLLGSAQVYAADFAFDRPGTGFSTSTVPVGQLAWEQGLPSASYTKSGEVKTTTLNADMLFRTGLTDSLELQLGWDGPAWEKVKANGTETEDEGLGDVRIGFKKAIDLNDEKLSMALLAEAVIATGNTGFSNEDDIYSISSAVAYDYSSDLTTSITMRYEWQDGDWAFQAVPTIEYIIGGKWSGFSEFVYRKAESESKEYALGTGLLYAMNERIQLDASIGTDLDGIGQSYTAGLGISFLF